MSPPPPPPPPPPRWVEGDSEQETVQMLTRTASQLNSPRCYTQKPITDFIQQKRFEVNKSLRGGGSEVVELVSAICEDDDHVPIPPDIRSIPPQSDEEAVFPTTPSEGTDRKHTLVEEVTSNDDIGGTRIRTEQNILNECELNKKRMWCNKHDCGLRCSNVSSKTWQYNKSKMKYMYVTKNVKKYVCLSKCGRQVQPLVKEATGGKQTTPDAEILGNSNGSMKHDYSGATLHGSEVVIRSAGI